VCSMAPNGPMRAKGETSACGDNEAKPWSRIWARQGACGDRWRYILGNTRGKVSLCIKAMGIRAWVYYVSFKLNI
jgi:hypothetical protein